jgi:heme exporter protein D
MFVWTLLGVGLAVLILLSIVSMKMERGRYVREKQASVAAPSAERPVPPVRRNP